jgi:hypothetical protein
MRKLEGSNLTSSYRRAESVGFQTSMQEPMFMTFNSPKGTPRLAYKRNNIARFHSCFININPRNMVRIETALLADFRSLLY